MTTFGSEDQNITADTNDEFVDVGGYGDGNNGQPPPYEVNDPNQQQDNQQQDNQQQYEQQEYEPQDNQQQEYEPQDNQQQQYEQPPPENNYDPPQEQQQYNEQQYNNDYEQPTGGNENTDVYANDDQAAAAANDNDFYAEPEDLVAQTQTAEEDEEEIKPTSAINKGDNEYTPFFSNYTIRTLYISIMFFLFAVCSMGYWTTDYVTKYGQKDDLAGGYALTASGVLFIFFGSLVAFIIALLQLLKKELPFAQYFMYTAMALYVLGGVLYIIGGMAVAAGYNNLYKDGCEKLDDKYKGYCSAYAGIWFVEGTLVGGLAIIFGVDLWRKFMGWVPFRIYLNVGFYVFISLVGFFCFAIVSTNMQPDSDDKQDNGSTGTVAAGYFFVFIILTIYLVAILIPFVRDRLKTPIIDFIYCIIFLLFGLLLAIGYWALVSNIDSIGGTSGTTDDGKNYNSVLKTYYVGISFIHMFMVFFIACDIQMGKYMKGFVPSSEEKSNDNDNGDQFEQNQYGDSQKNNGEDY